MKYARMQDGVPVEIIEPAFTEGGVEIPITERFHPSIVSTLVEWSGGELPLEHNAIAFSQVRVTMRQARLALLAAGKLGAVTAAIASLPSPQKEAAQIEWEYAATVDRDSEFVQLMSVALQLDAAALDTLFAEAAAL